MLRSLEAAFPTTLPVPLTPAAAEPPGLLKKHGEVVESRKAQGQAKTNGVIGHKSLASNPTVTRKVASDFGITGASSPPVRFGTPWLDVSKIAASYARHVRQRNADHRSRADGL